MEREASQEQHNDEEINIYEHWLTLKRWWIFILLTTLISIGIAYVNISKEPKIYLVSNILVLDQIQEEEIFTKSQAIATLSSFNTLLENNKESLSHILKLQDKDLNNIRSIRVSDNSGSESIRVDIETTDGKSGVALLEALPAFFLADSMIAKQIAAKKILMEKKKNILKDIIDDPVKKMKLPSNAVLYIPLNDIYTLHEKYDRLVMFMEKIDNGQIVSLAWKTEPPLNPIIHGSKKRIILSAFAGCFFGIVVSFLLEWLRNARRARHTG